ncbi:hypothetical protein SISSUDRAFT_1050137 [Sistotremastrum suecicum HHB10207 ss-3]|uniref:SUZ domain-containing protein n=1 Tax=Sistotremastrum suecicum HHB10207 ss-3 TaxID=1314776 RepID=A0A166BE73_9AGAM|nr:hypothetical protein SISSUDRAFT_1050137 [Sistotremastrum suecicum HHB10207 ss-3]
MATSSWGVEEKVKSIPKAKKAPVRDDWEDESEEEDSVQTWNDANTKAPMPEIISSSSTKPPPPPTEALQTLKILKRRPQTSKSPSSSSSTTTSKTLEEREKSYQEARERIFNSSTGATVTSDNTSNDNDKSKS